MGFCLVAADGPFILLESALVSQQLSLAWHGAIVRIVDALGRLLAHTIDELNVESTETRTLVKFYHLIFQTFRDGSSDGRMIGEGEAEECDEFDELHVGKDDDFDVSLD